MSVLSDQDIIRELGKGILVHPLKSRSIKACDICLTASEYAYAIGQQEQLTIETDPDTQQKYFYIPPRDTALVWTDESIYLSNKFRGPLYSIVLEVSRGIGHIGTRVNPCWSGVLCIALHNISNQAIRINVRDVNQPVVYLAIEKLSSKSSTKSNMDKSARLDVLRGQSNAQKIFDYFNLREHNWMTGDTDSLKRLMEASDEYKKLRKGVYDQLLGLLGSDAQARWTAGSTIVAFLTFVIALIALFKPSPPSPKNTPTLQQTQPVNNIPVNKNK